LFTRDAILFAADATRPRMVKVPMKHAMVETFFDEPAEQFEVPDHARHPWKRSDRPEWIGRVYPGGPALSDGKLLVAFINDNFCNDGSMPNGSVEALTGGLSRRGWADHIFVMRKKDIHDPEFQDAVLEEDLPILRTYMMN